MRPAKPLSPNLEVLRPQSDGQCSRCARDRELGAVRVHRAVPRLAGDKIDGRRADEAGNEQARWPQIEVIRRPDLLDAAGAHADDAIGHRRCLDLVVGYQHGRHAEMPLQRLDLGAHGKPERRVEVGKRLVEQQQLRLLHQCTRECDALLLAAGELAGATFQQFRDPDEVGGGLHPARRLHRAASS